MRCGRTRSWQPRDVRRPGSRSSVVGGGLWGRRSAEGAVWGPHSLEAPGAPEALVYPWEPCGWSFGPCWLTTSGLKTVHRSPARVFIYFRSKLDFCCCRRMAGRVHAELREHGLGTGGRCPHTWISDQLGSELGLEEPSAPAFCFPPGAAGPSGWPSWENGQLVTSTPPLRRVKSRLAGGVPGVPTITSPPSRPRSISPVPPPLVGAGSGCSPCPAPEVHWVCL